MHCRALLCVVVVWFCAARASPSTAMAVGADGVVDVSAAVRESNGIQVSANDDRDVRFLQLPNGMKAMVVSDHSTDKAGAALAVNVGSNADPEHVPGLAHFCEHMCFLGTDKYPDENAYSKYLSAHSGWSNAYTDRERTVYYFEVASDSLAPALDMFAEFFKTPKFTAAATSRELDAVDAEHAKNTQSDMWRDYQLDKSTSDPAHPYHKFATGDSGTLRDTPEAEGTDVRQALLDFHGTYYSANLMTLTVVGKEGLDELEASVRELFTPVVDKGTPVPKPADPTMPWREGEDTALLQYMLPVAEKRTLSLAWQLPPQHDTYESKPDRYFANLIGHEGPGSLLSYLKAQGLASGLSAGSRVTDLTFSVFQVKIALTPAGVGAVDDVIAATFSYLRMIREEGPQRYLWEEQAAVETAYAKFLPKQGASSTAQSLAVHLSTPGVPPARIPLCGVLFYKWDAGAMEEFLSHLTVAGLRARVIAKEVEEKCDQSERWYGTKFGSAPFTPAQAEAWGTAPRLPPTDMHLPAKNEFLATDFTLAQPKAPKPSFHDAAVAMQAAAAAAEEKEGGLWGRAEVRGAAAALLDGGASGAGLRPVTPTLLVNTPALRLSWHGDAWFGEPKVRVNAVLHSPAVYASPRSSLLTALFCRLVKESLNEFAYAAELAELSYGCQASHGVNLSFAGYSHKLGVLADKVLGAVAAPEFTDAQFDRQLDAEKRALESRAAQDAVRHAMYESGQVEVGPTWHTADKLAAITAGVTADDVRAFAGQLLASASADVHVHGNADEAGARAFGDKFTTLLAASTPLLAAQETEHRTVVAPAGAEVRLLHQHPNGDEPNSAVRIALQLGPDDTPTRAIGHLLVQLLQEPAFDVLRTRESLGYIVHVGLSREGGAVTLLVVVQSNKVPARVLEGRMEAFLAAHTATLATTLTEEAFATAVSSVIKDQLKATEQLSREAGYVWAETRRACAFNRAPDIAAYLLDHATVGGALAVLQRAVVRGGDLRRKVAVLVFGRTGAAAGAEGDAVTDSRGHVASDGEAAAADATPVAAPPAVVEAITSVSGGGLGLVAGPSVPSIAAVFTGTAREAEAAGQDIPVLELSGRGDTQAFVAAASAWPNARVIGAAAWAGSQ